MAYIDVSDMVNNGDLVARETACAAVEGQADPVGWVGARVWQLAAQPGWSDAWASATASGNPAPGRDPAVISDAMILSGVQAVAAAS